MEGYSDGRGWTGWRHTDMVMAGLGGGDTARVVWTLKRRVYVKPRTGNGWKRSQVRITLTYTNSDSIFSR